MHVATYASARTTCLTYVPFIYCYPALIDLLLPNGDLHSKQLLLTVDNALWF